MSLGKLPAIKGLLSTNNKRRFKSELSVDMISPPLEDFRHTMHVGRGGDVFGDTSFLSNYGGSTNDEGSGNPDESPSGSKTTRFLSRTLRHVRKNPAARLRGGSRDFSSPPPPISPIIKNAISLPQLNLDTSNGSQKRALLPISISSPDQPLCSYSLHSGFVTLPRFCRLDQNFEETSGTLCADYRLLENGDLARSDSLTSFTVDLGPSLMSEVLQLIDNSSSLFSISKNWEREEEEEESSSMFEMESPSISSVDSVRMCVSNSGLPDTLHETQQEHDDDEVCKQTMIDTSLRCPIRAEVSMEPRRFQQAANALVRHFGGGSSLLKEQQRSEEDNNRPSSFSHRRAPHSFPETEEEIKV